MIAFSRFELQNGLRLVVHEDRSTPLVAVNVLYDVGARDESPQKTGFAHLFEHLMFGGSANIPDYDEPIQLAGGENNAFTNNDITNFYNVLPAENIETALWLESDRMLSLNFDQKVLDVQKKVVVEEFKETCLNQPYGDSWHHLADLTFKVHPYRWPTIGLEPQHVENATLEEVKEFFFKFYRPNNAVVVITGNIDTEEAKRLVEKWFGEIPKGETPERQLPTEPVQENYQAKDYSTNVPLDAIFLAFHSPARLDPDYYASDILSDILCNGQSSRLFQNLLKEKEYFSSIDCYISGSIDPGLLIIEGKIRKGVDPATVEAAIWQEIDRLKSAPVSEEELQKYKNKIESTLTFSEMSILNKAINLAFFELLGDADLINHESEKYKVLTPEKIQQSAIQLLNKENCSRLLIKAVEEPPVMT